MRLLIAGWHGQIARSLLELAAADPGINALSIGRAALDMCTSSSIRSTFIASRPDVLINTAAYTRVDKAESDEQSAFALNSAGAAAFAKLAARYDTPIIHLSTNYVFDGSKDEAYVEDDPPSPNTVYGRSKLEGELAVADANPMHLILRTSWVVSPFGRNFVSAILDQAQVGATIDVVDDQVGSPASALHLARMILTLAERIAADRRTIPWGTYHLASPDAATWLDLAERLIETSASLGGPTAELRPIASGAFPTAAPRPANARLDSSRLERAFGLRLPSWSDGLAECVERYLDPERSRSPARPVSS